MKKLTIANNNRAIEILWKEAPMLGMFPEFFKNAQEAIGSSTLYIDAVRFGRTEKAILINDGKGMNEEDMMNLSKIFGDPKIENGKSEDNYNTGARLMSIRANNLGTVYVSKHNGIIRNTWLGLLDGEYVAEFNLPKFMKDYGKEFGFNGDWTAVILMGNSENQNTYLKPYGNLTAKAPFELQTWYRFVKPSIDVYFKNKKFTPLFEAYSDAKHWVVEPEKGVKFHYRLVPKNLGAPVNGILHYTNELFDVCVNSGRSNLYKSANHLYAALGAVSVKDELSVIVELTKDYPAVQTNYRNSLQDPDTRAPIELVDFENKLEAYMPVELKEYIEEKNNSKYEKEIKNNSENFAMKMFNLLDLNLNKLVATRKDTKIIGEIGTLKKTIDKLKERLNNKSSSKSGEKPNGINPTPLEEKKGIPVVHYEFLTDEGVYNYEMKKFEIGFVVNNSKAYFNPKNPYFTVAIDAAKEKLGKNCPNDETVKNKFAEYLTKSFVITMGYDYSTLGEEGERIATGGILLGLANEALANGTFINELKYFIKG